MEKDQLSKTAAFVAIKFYGLTRWEHYRSFFELSTVEFYDRLVQSLPGKLHLYHNLLRSEWLRSFFFWGEEVLLPGDLMHILARKWYLEQMIEEEISKGVKQVIVLGAGFDHLAWRYSQKNIRSIEIDTPGMADLKRDFYKINYPASKKPAVIDAFFPETKISDVLQHSSIDPELKTVIVAEGFFDYLEKVTVSQILNDIHSCFGKDTSLITTHFALDELSWFNAFIFKNSIRMVGENLKLNLDICSFQSLLKEQNFFIKYLYSDKTFEGQLQKKLQTTRVVMNGFYILGAQV